jgi:predicted nucleotidyltransferase/uncharacterized protein with HEPN domain
VRIETTPLTRSEQPQVRLRELLRLQGDEIRRIAADHGANNVRVFGSVAHGEDHPGSDVDLLVDMELGRTLLDQVRLRRALIELLGVEVDLVTTRGLLDRDGDPERSHSDLMARRKRRRVDEIVADIGEAAEAAEELVGRGRDAWEKDVLLRLAGEAVMGRIADAASRLPDELKAGIPEVPWDDLRDVRILVDHIYHRIDYDALWGTLRDDVADLLERLRRWQT